MRVVHFIVTRNVENEIRLRKILQWMKLRGCDPREHGVVLGGPNFERNAPWWLDGQIDGFPIFRIHGRVAGLARKAIEELKPTIVHAHELDALWALCYVDGEQVEKPNARLIYEAHEYEPGRALPFAKESEAEERRRWEALTVPLIDEMIVVSPAIQEATEKDHGIWPHLIPNSFMRRPADAMEQEKKGRPAIAFSGNVTHCRGLEVAVPAIQSLGAPLNFQVKVFGDQRHEPTVNMLQKVGAKFMGRWPYPYPHERESLVEALAVCDVGLNLVDLRVPSYQMALPNKFFEYAFAGVPIVANNQKDVGELIEKYNLGVVANISGHSSSLEAVQILAHAIENAVEVEPDTEAFISDWCWENTGGKVIDELYQLGEEAADVGDTAA